MIPTMCPGDHEQAQGVVIKYVHAVVFHTSRYATTGMRPFQEMIPCRGIAVDHGKQGLVAFEI